MGMLISILILLGVALVASWLTKKAPIIETISNLAVFAFLLGIFFKLGGVTTVADLVDKIPGLQYMLAIPAGIALGNVVGKYLPF